jgi:hypothetical protein
MSLMKQFFFASLPVPDLTHSCTETAIAIREEVGGLYVEGVLAKAYYNARGLRFRAGFDF